METNTAVPTGIFDLAFILNEDTQILHFASSDNTLLFVTSDYFLGKRVVEVLPPGAAATCLECIQQAFASNMAAECEYSFDLDGKVCFFRAVVSPLMGRNLPGQRQAIVTIQNITRDKLQQNELLEINNRFKTIFESANAGMAFANRQGMMVDVNKAFEDLVGYSADELKNRHFNMFIHPDDMQDESVLLQKIADSEIHDIRVERRFKRKGGDTIWVDATISAIRNESGELTYFVGICTDITKRKEQELELAALNATKDKLFSIIAHDLRNPLNVISGLVNILANDFEKEEQRGESKQILSMLSQSTLGANILLENLLQWARAQTNTISFCPTKTELKFIADDLIHQLAGMAGAKNISLTSSVKSERTYLLDWQMISTILRNLISNAIKFTPKGGSIELNIRAGEKEVVFEVKDNGIGMDKTRVDHLFDINRIQITAGTANEKGTGLGLLVCNEFTKAHGGTLTVTSEPGKGSTFTLRIPQA
ncbi:MAG: PAS domain-containing sensor histidine kinase [Bacteroidia bacterium]|nr:PAS domain-containing sensor histidine kinase [Bacteroidia bacterium]